MANPYPDFVMRWADGTNISPGLREMLRSGLDPGFAIEHAEFAWAADGALAMTLRLAVSRGQPKPQIWELQLSYPPQEATALQPGAEPEHREWFTMMVRTHVTEWWETRAAGSAGMARRIK